MAIEKNNATCAICGKGYYMCRSCKDQFRLNPWKLHTDTSEHYKVFQIIHGYTIGVYTKNEAKERLKTVNLSDMKSFLPEIKSMITSILEEKEIKKSKEIESEILDNKFISSEQSKKSEKLTNRK